MNNPQRRIQVLSVLNRLDAIIDMTNYTDPEDRYDNLYFGLQEFIDELEEAILDD